MPATGLNFTQTRDGSTLWGKSSYLVHALFQLGESWSVQTDSCKPALLHTILLYVCIHTCTVHCIYIYMGMLYEKMENRD